MIREIVQANKKCYWDIDIIEGQKIYMGTYSCIDFIDHMIKNLQMKYQIWKYWNFPILHAMPLSVCVDYEIHMEIAEGELDKSQKHPTPCDFWTFRDVSSTKMLKYYPFHKKYSSDERIQLYSQQNNDKSIGLLKAMLKAGREEGNHQSHQKILATIHFDIVQDSHGNKSSE